MARYVTNRKTGSLEELPGEDEASAIVTDIKERFRPVIDVLNREWVPFPEITVGIDPVGPHVIVQKRLPRTKIGSLHTAADTQEVDSYSERVGKLVAVSPAAYRDTDGNPAFGVGPEGWPKAGDLVRVPSHGGDPYFRTAADGTKVELKVFHWRDVTGIVKDETL